MTENRRQATTTGESKTPNAPVCALFSIPCILPSILTNLSVSAIVCRLDLPPPTSDSSPLKRKEVWRKHFVSKGEPPVRERQKEIARKRKRKEETLRAKRKAAVEAAAAKKGK